MVSMAVIWWFICCFYWWLLYGFFSIGFYDFCGFCFCGFSPWCLSMLIVRGGQNMSRCNFHLCGFPFA